MYESAWFRPQPSVRKLILASSLTPPAHCSCRFTALGEARWKPRSGSRSIPNGGSKAGPVSPTASSASRFSVARSPPTDAIPPPCEGASSPGSGPCDANYLGPGGISILSLAIQGSTALDQFANRRRAVPVSAPAGGKTCPPLWRAATLSTAFPLSHRPRSGAAPSAECITLG